MVQVINSCVSSLLDADVIDNTFRVMCDLRSALDHVLVHKALLSQAEKARLKASLLRLSSESIRQALHKRELGITNAIIASKNKILVSLGVTPDEFHREIRPEDFSYDW